MTISKHNSPTSTTSCSRASLGIGDPHIDRQQALQRIREQAKSSLTSLLLQTQPSLTEPFNPNRLFKVCLGVSKTLVHNYLVELQEEFGPLVFGVAINNLSLKDMLSLKFKKNVDEELKQRILDNCRRATECLNTLIIQHTEEEAESCVKFFVEGGISKSSLDAAENHSNPSSPTSQNPNDKVYVILKDGSTGEVDWRTMEKCWSEVSVINIHNPQTPRKLGKQQAATLMLKVRSALKHPTFQDSMCVSNGKQESCLRSSHLTPMCVMQLLTLGLCPTKNSKRPSYFDVLKEKIPSPALAFPWDETHWSPSPCLTSEKQETLLRGQFNLDDLFFTRVCFK